ncbi:MAG TPA: hypothetical protein VFF26_14615 [Gallionella sp.]|nr:hypothetical protein [Gallionella sp.]
MHIRRNAYRTARTVRSYRQNPQNRRLAQEFISTEMTEAWHRLASQSISAPDGNDSQHNLFRENIVIACLSAFPARPLGRVFTCYNIKTQTTGSDGDAWSRCSSRTPFLRNLVASLLAAMLFTGCALVENIGNYDGYAVKPLKGTQMDNLREALTIKSKSPDSPEPLVSQECFKTAPANTVDCTSQRNQTISFLMAESNNLCVEHIKSIYGNEAAFNIATGSLAVLTAGWASISSGGQTKTLSALSAFASAERSLVNETIYKSMLTSAIGTKIEEARATKGKALLLHKKEPYDNYRIEDALYDIIDYHESCSFYSGLQKALKEGTQVTPEAKRAQLEIQRQTLEQQILAYNAKINPTLKGVPAKSEDPLLDSMINRFRALDQEIGALSGFPASTQQKTESPDPSSQKGKPPSQ